MANRQNDAIDRLCNTVDENGGCVLWAGLTKKNHLKLRVRAPNGSEHTFFYSGTPSDSRGLMNKLSLIRRTLRQESQ